MGDPSASNTYLIYCFFLVLRGSGRGGDEGVSCVVLGDSGGGGQQNRTVVNLAMVLAVWSVSGSSTSRDLYDTIHHDFVQERTFRSTNI